MWLPFPDLPCLPCSYCRTVHFLVEALSSNECLPHYCSWIMVYLPLWNNLSFLLSDALMLFFFFQRISQFTAKIYLTVHYISKRWTCSLLASSLSSSLPSQHTLLLHQLSRPFGLHAPFTNAQQRDSQVCSGKREANTYPGDCMREERRRVEWTLPF